MSYKQTIETIIKDRGLMPTLLIIEDYCRKQDAVEADADPDFDRHLNTIADLLADAGNLTQGD